MVLGKLDIHVQKIEAGLLVTPRIKINSEWIKDLNFRARTTKFLEETLLSHDKIWQ